VVIQTDGSTSLTEVANQFYLNSSSGSGPALEYRGADVTAGEFGGWTPIGAVQTASGYDVAWKVTGANEYTVWTTNSNGNYTENLTGTVSGTSTALEALEPIFDQNLNGDGKLTSTVIQTDGSTRLTEVADQVSSAYYLNSSTGSGPALKYHGADVTTGEFGGWTPIGAVQTASGYDVAWKVTGANEYTVWTTDSSGNYTGNLVGTVTGTSTALEALEPIFGQDLNGDGVIGLYAAPNTTLQINSSLAGSSGSTTIGTGATLELAAADTASVTFRGTTGTLQLEAPSTFTGEIFGFTGNGTLSGSDHIDLSNIKYNSVHDSYANGVLTITDGSGDTDKLSFNGSYTLANFSFASDGSGGTIVYDPPVTASSAQNTAAPGPVVPSETTTTGGTLDPIELSGIAFYGQSTLGYLPNSNQADAIPSFADGIGNANIALLGNYMASIFAIAGDNHGTTSTVAQAAQPHDQSLLSSPHHA
jgi:serralysin